jgi:N-methylhydantoinase A/oxoprolinase/acetone carboxylase beta subunit
MPLVGLGAPASLILPAVAELLHTEYISPPHYQVANAIGAAVGSLMSAREAWVIPQSRNQRMVGYYVQSGSERRRFRTLEEAITFAEQVTIEEVNQDALSLGIHDPQLHTEKLPDGAESYRIRTVAVGQPLISETGKQIS